MVIPKHEWAMFFQVHPESLREKKGQRPGSPCAYLFCSARAEKVTVCVKGVGFGVSGEEWSPPSALLP